MKYYYKGIIVNILITGVAGFIGSHLADRLIINNKVIGIDNFCDYYQPQIKERNLEQLKANPNFMLYRIDIRDNALLGKCFSENKIDLVIHLAAMAGVRPSISDPLLYTEVNIVGTINVLEMCKKFNIKKLIFASSSSVYGNNEKVPFAEDDFVDYPISPYAFTKKAGELICHSYHHLYQISIACLRFFTVYGPRQRPDLAIYRFTEKIINNETITLFGDGTSKRDYTYITDIIDGIVQSIEYVRSGCKYEIFNLGESTTISLVELVRTLEDEIGNKALTEQFPMQPGDVNQTYADITKSNKILGYYPSADFKTGIQFFVEWYKKTHNT